MHLTLKGMENVDSATQNILRRSVFNTVAARQYVLAFKSFDWRPHADAQALALSRMTGLLTSLSVEDLHNIQNPAMLLVEFDTTVTEPSLFGIFS